MNRLVIIGNGFDLAHGLKTSYKDFINWYWEQRLTALPTTKSEVSSDCLCKLKLNVGLSWSDFINKNHDWSIGHGIGEKNGLKMIEAMKNNRNQIYIISEPFFENITKSIETKGWVDIENEYYQLLKIFSNKPDDYKELNKQLKFLQDKLVEYLKTLPKVECNKEIVELLKAPFEKQDISTHDKDIALASMLDSSSIPNIYYPKYVLLLSFNYTNTVEMYTEFTMRSNYIHGSLSKENEIIFGYGDELDEDYKEILDKNDNELLNYVKSVKYLEADHYKQMLRFIEAEPFQVYIMGHSCGNSDRTLLNKIFEHKNCVSIKPFYYQKPDGTDTFLEIVQNIYRNFTDMSLYRDRVVNKTRCIPLPQSQKQ